MIRSLRCKTSWSACAKVLLAVTSAAFLTACSGAFGSPAPTLSATLGLEKKQPLPDPPPTYKTCFREPLAEPKKATADEKVLGLKSWGAKKQLCGENMLLWYEGLQKAEATGAPPPATQPAPTKAAAAAKQPKPRHFPKIDP